MNQGQRNALRVAQNFQRKATIEGGGGLEIAMITEILSSHIMTVDIDARAILNPVPQPTIRQTAELLFGTDWLNNPPTAAVEGLRQHLSANFLVHQGLVSYNNTDIFTEEQITKAHRVARGFMERARGQAFGSGVNPITPEFIVTRLRIQLPADAEADDETLLRIAIFLLRTTWDDATPLRYKYFLCLGFFQLGWVYRQMCAYGLGPFGVHIPMTPTFPAIAPTAMESMEPVAPAAVAVAPGPGPGAGPGLAPAPVPVNLADIPEHPANDNIAVRVPEPLRFLLEELECPICMELVHRPVTLPCGHTFCERCKVSSEQAGNTVCAVCRAPFDPASRIRLNTKIEAICDRLRAFPMPGGRRGNRKTRIRSKTRTRRSPNNHTRRSS